VKIVSPLLGGLARSGGLSEVTDLMSEIAVLPEIVLCTTLPLPVDEMGVAASANATPQNSSIHLKNEMNRTNLGAASNLLATLSKGLWRFNAFVCLASNFTQATIIPALRLSFNFPGSGFNMAIISAIAVGQNPPYTVLGFSREVDIMFSKDGCQIFEDVIATNGVATNNLIVTWDLQVSKLL